MNGSSGATCINERPVIGCRIFFDKPRKIGRVVLCEFDVLETKAIQFGCSHGAVGEYGERAHADGVREGARTVGACDNKSLCPLQLDFRGFNALHVYDRDRQSMMATGLQRARDNGGILHRLCDQYPHRQFGLRRLCLCAGSFGEGVPALETGITPLSVVEAALSGEKAF